MPIASYVRFKRLKQAEQLIKDGSSVTLAAERTGFTDYGYFGKLFKRYIGKTPLKSKT
jgi:AraC-like DNA-binding protein